MQTVYYNEFRTKNDVNGNPRRMIEAYDENGELLRVVKFAYYDVEQALRYAFISKESYKCIALSTCVHVTPKEFRMRTAKAVVL